MFLSPMKTCPHCKMEVCVAALPHQGYLTSVRLCPGCGGAFTADPRTKYLQAVWIGIALLSLAFTLLLYIRGTTWLIPACVSYFLLAIILVRGNKRMFLVAAEPDNT